MEPTETLASYESHESGEAGARRRGPGSGAAPLDDDHVIDVIDELLIEEISIDGMCGVY